MAATHRTVTPAMRAHLQRIAALGGRATASKHGGWAAPHAARKTKTSTKPALGAARAVLAGAKGPSLKVKPLTSKDLISGKKLGLPPTVFQPTAPRRVSTLNPAYRPASRARRAATTPRRTSRSRSAG